MKLLSGIVLAPLVWLCLTSMGVAAEVLLLDGTTLRGDVLAIEQGTVQVRQENEEIRLPLERVLSIEWSADAPDAKASGELLLLDDGSRLHIVEASSDGRFVSATSPASGPLKIPQASIKAVRFKSETRELNEQWDKLLQKPSADDMLVIQKGMILDFLPGVVTEYNAKEVLFLYQGSEIPVKRERVFGMIHPRKSAGAAETLCRLLSRGGDELLLRRLSLTDGQLRGELLANVSVELPVEQITKLDFSLGRLAYLSDLNPEGVEHTPYFDTVWPFQRDRTNTGAPLRLGGKQYSKGLWIHSKTLLNYRLAGEYTRLQCLLGIDDAVAENGLGHVQVRIKADEKILFDEEVSALDDPRLLDLDLTNARFLQILVDFGKGLDVGDHLVLGEAKLIK